MKPLAGLFALRPGRRRWLAGGLAVVLVGGAVALASRRPRPTAPPDPPAAADAATPTATPALATGTAAGQTQSGSPPPARDPATPTASATAAPPPKTVDVTGTIEPVRDEGVSFAVSGTVAEIDVQPGEHVAAGTVLARLDASTLRTQLQQAQASVAQAQAALAGNQAKVRNDQLAVQQAQDTLNQDQADLATAEAAESLGAPVGGVVESVSATVGQSLTAGQTVLTIVPPGAPVEIHTQVAQQSDQAVQVGEYASANIPAASQTVAGRVTAVGTGTPATGSASGGPPPAGSSGEGTLEVTITVQSPPASLRDGMTAIANIDTGGTGGAPPVIQAQGSVQYASEWDVTAPQGGTVAQLLVQPGATVSQGEMLAQLSGPSLDSAVQRAEQTVQQGRDALAQARATAQTDGTAQAAADQASLASARAAEQEAAANLQAATLTAPFSGTIGPVSLSLGEAVSAGGGSAATTGSGAGGGSIELIGEAGFEVDVSVPDTQIGQVHVGEKAWVTPASGAQPLQATVSQFTPQASGATGSAPPAFPVTLLIRGGQGQVLAGETAEVAIQPGA